MNMLLCSQDIRLLLLLACCLGACTNVRFGEDAADYEHQIARLQSRLADAPDNEKALRDLGIIYVRTRRAQEGLPYLEQAHALDETNPATLFYYGLALEAQGQPEKALHQYAAYPDVAIVSPYRRLLAGRYQWLSRRIIQTEMVARMADETAYRSVPPNTIAVFPLIYQGTEERLAPLGRGMAEMMAVDLSAIEALDVLERVRVQVLIDEAGLALGANPVVARSSAPRAGYLLGAERLVVGTYNLLADDVLRLDVAALPTTGQQEIRQAAQADALDNLFTLEKDLVFSLLDELGLEPTPAEREKIERVPTHNLQAFLAYSKGLEEDDAGRYEAAAQHFQEAARLDPEFQEAAMQAEVAENMSVVSGTTDEVMLADASGAPTQESSMQEMVENRQQSLGDTVGASYVPGPDSRNPVTENPDPIVSLPTAPRPRSGN